MTHAARSTACTHNDLCAKPPEHLPSIKPEIARLPLPWINAGRGSTENSSDTYFTMAISRERALSHRERLPRE